MNLYELSELIIGTVPVGWEVLYISLTYILSVVSVLLIISPIIIIFKILGGR